MAAGEGQADPPANPDHAVARMRFDGPQTRRSVLRKGGPHHHDTGRHRQWQADRNHRRGGGEARRVRNFPSDAVSGWKQRDGRITEARRERIWPEKIHSAIFVFGSRSKGSRKPDSARVRASIPPWIPSTTARRLMPPTYAS